LWIGSLLFLLYQDFSTLPWYLIGLGVLWLSFLYTGLFITAHDAMHGIVLPANRKINDLIGKIAVRLYAFFSYKNLLTKHWEHHRHPASADDPDFHDGEHPVFFRWYFHFMSSYISWQQLLGMSIIFNLLHYLLQINFINLIIFWVIPALLSTFQLFYFGTYLPHRELSEPYKDHHRARSNNYSVFFSLLSCYHFGYHWEHHEFPHIAWWRLPKMRRLTLEADN
jgi:beta-carotene ketolase (CrtW type)